MFAEPTTQGCLGQNPQMILGAICTARTVLPWDMAACQSWVSHMSLGYLGLSE